MRRGSVRQVRNYPDLSIFGEKIINGNVTIVLFNHGSTDFTIKKGDRVAQLILERICNEDVEEVEALPESTRGEKGFGSTDTTA